jgi:hypothetical protein
MDNIEHAEYRKCVTPYILFIYIPKGSWCLGLGREKEKQDQGDDIG